MKKLITAALLTAAAATAAPAFAADVGVSIGFSQPGVYGRVDIGRFPQPVLVAPHPVLVTPRHAYRADPVYLWVPPFERAQWGRYCGRYNACGAPVYFVQDRWYRDHVVAQRRYDHRYDRRDDRRWDRQHDRREDRRDDRHDGHHDNGHGNDHGDHHH
jgi:hypothetical protein